MTERKELEKKLDDLISRIVRSRDHNCITCGKPMIFETSTAGHFMHRRHIGTRWSLVNVNGQCWKCNSKDDSKLYEEKMIAKYGERATQLIKDTAHANIKYSLSDLKEILRELLEYQSQMP